MNCFRIYAIPGIFIPTIEKLSHAIEDIYKSVKDSKIKNTERLVKFVWTVFDEIEACVNSVAKKGTDFHDIELFLQYSDKLAAGELIDIDAFISENMQLTDIASSSGYGNDDRAKSKLSNCFDI